MRPNKTPPKVHSNLKDSPVCNLKNILGITKNPLVVQYQTFCTLLCLWSMKSEINRNFIDIEMTRLLVRPRIFEISRTS